MTTDIEQELADLDAQKDEARQRQRALLADLAEALEADADAKVRAYWADRAKADPDDPEVLRARADLGARDRGTANGGTAVTAKPASVKGKAN